MKHYGTSNPYILPSFSNMHFPANSYILPGYGDKASWQDKEKPVIGNSENLAAANFMGRCLGFDKM